MQNRVVGCPERVVVLTIGLLTGTSIWALAVIAILANFTAIERIVYVWRVTDWVALASTTQKAISHSSAQMSDADHEREALPGMQEDRFSMQNAINLSNDTSAGNSHSPTSIVGINEGHQ